MPLGKKEKSLIEKFLRNVHVFKNFSEVHLKRITGDFALLNVNKNEKVVLQSDDSTDLYIVLEGRVKVSFMNPEGNEFILTAFRQGDFFGEMSLIDGKPRSASVTAEEKTLLGVLKRERFFREINDHPVIAVDLLTSLVERLRKADEMIESLAFLDVRERLIKFLVDITDREGRPDGAGFNRIDKRTHRDMASSIGSSREAVSKVLKVLANEKLVDERSGYLFVSEELHKELAII